MGTIELCSLPNVSALVKAAYAEDEPVIVFDGPDECLVVMRPPVFERILFDTDLLNAANRPALCL